MKRRQLLKYAAAVGGMAVQSHPRLDGLPVRPLPYDSDLQPAPAWVALQTAFEDARKVKASHNVLVIFRTTSL